MLSSSAEEVVATRKFIKIRDFWVSADSETNNNINIIIDAWE